MSFADVTAVLAARDGVLPQAWDASSAGNGPSGTTADQQLRATADDGVQLHVEIYDAADADVTVVFCHGYLLDLTSWYVQRTMLAGKVRVVLWDLRGHGRSGWGTPPNATIDQVGRDLFAVLETAAPSGRIVLVGHSMGAMAILGLAEAHPELFGDRVIGVVLCSTSAGRLSTVTVGLPARAAHILHRTVPVALTTLQRQARLINAVRRSMGGVSFLLTSRYLFGARVPKSVAKVTTALMSAVPVQVIAEFYNELVSYDKHAALPILGRVPVLIMVGERDLITPVEHAEALASAIPGAELTVIPGAGHLLALERPAEITRHVRDLLTRARETTPPTDVDPPATHARP